MTAALAPQISPDQSEPQGQRATSLGQQSPTVMRVIPDPLAPPYPPIEKVRGKEYPGQDAKPGEKLNFIRRLLQQTESEHLARVKAHAYHTLVANGKHHIAWSNRSRRWEETPPLDNEIRVTINLVRPVLRARTNRLLPKNFDYGCIPDSNDYDARDQAKVGERFLAAMRERTNLVRLTDLALELSYAGGVGFLKSFFNPTIGPARPAQLAFVEQVPVPLEDEDNPGQPLLDENNEPITELKPQKVMRYVDETGQPVMDNDPNKAAWYRPGDTDLAVRSLFTIRWNSDATGWSVADGLRWVIDQEAVPLSVARERYPDFADKIATNGEAQTALNYQRMAALSNLRQTDRAATHTSAINTPSEWTTITEYWELPGPYFRDGRLIVFVGDIEAGDSPFPDCVFPFHPVYDEPTPLSPAGRGCVSDMVAPSQIYNEIWASLVAAARLQGLGQWMGPNVPGMPDLITSQHGQMVKVPIRALQGRPLRDVVMPLVHPDIPTDRLVLLQECKTAIYDLGAYHEITRGQVPPGVDSGVAVRALSEREDGQLARSKFALQQTMIDVARAQLKIAKSRYAPGDERWIPVDRPDMSYQVESVDGAKLPDPERLQITISGFHPRTAEELRADIKEAMLNGWLTPAQGLKALDLGRGVETAFSSEQRHYAKARAENMLIERGQCQQVPMSDPATGQPLIDEETGNPMTQIVDQAGEPLMLPDVDDHVLHMAVLEEILLDRTKPPEQRQLALAHWFEHNQTLSYTPPAPAPESSPGVSSDPQAPPPQ